MPSLRSRGRFAESFAQPRTKCGRTSTGGPNIPDSSGGVCSLTPCFLDWKKIGRLALTEVQTGDLAFPPGDRSHCSGNWVEKAVKPPVKGNRNSIIKHVHVKKALIMINVTWILCWSKHDAIIVQVGLVRHSDACDHSLSCLVHWWPAVKQQLHNFWCALLFNISLRSSGHRQCDSIPACSEAANPYVLCDLDHEVTEYDAPLILPACNEATTPYVTIRSQTVWRPLSNKWTPEV